MAIDELTRKEVSGKLAEFCSRRVPPHAINDVKLSFAWQKDHFVLYEERRLFMDPDNWNKMRIARFDYSSEERAWTLYYYDRNDKAHRHLDLDSNVDIDRLLRRKQQES